MYKRITVEINSLVMAQGEISSTGIVETVILLMPDLTEGLDVVVKIPDEIVKAHQNLFKILLNQRENRLAVETAETRLLDDLT